MKANKIFAVALAALTLVGFNACKKANNPDEPGKEGDLTLYYSLFPSNFDLNIS